jgi:hypothetical protein
MKRDLEGIEETLMNSNELEEMKEMEKGTLV